MVNNPEKSIPKFTKDGYQIAERNVTRIVKCLKLKKQRDVALWYKHDVVNEYFPTPMHAVEIEG